MAESSIQQAGVVYLVYAPWPYHKSVKGKIVVGYIHLAVCRASLALSICDGWFHTDYSDAEVVSYSVVSSIIE